MLSPSELIAKIKPYHPNLNEALIQKAYVFSKTSHGNQKRHSGDPYFLHPVAVAEILTELKLDQDTIIAALLHDVVEDTGVSLDDIEKEFGENVARLVNGVTKLSKIESIPSSERVAENFRKLALAMSEDIRVLLVKLADRLHNMRTLSYVPSEEKRIKKAKESLDIYAPLAARIGLNKIKDELQELSFEIIDPESRGSIIEKLVELKETKKDLIDKIINDLTEKLNQEGVKFKISGREKKPYSIWMKMKKQNVSFSRLYDVMAFRIIVESVPECYRVLGVVNSNYSMIPNTFKDYISTPKESGYKSLHLAILGPFNKKIEIQIRDHKMHEIADLGVASHWHYKENGPKSSSHLETQQYRWIDEITSLFENAEVASEALKEHKLQMHKNEVFCFTPNGDIFNLPAGATTVDFAYEIHSEVGNRCVSAKVNGIISPLRHKLENGDQVEIITSKSSKPSSNWLQFVTTSKAKYAIKSFIRSEKFSEYNTLGKAIINKFFASKNLEINEKILEKVLPHFGKKVVADLYVKIAEGLIARQEVLRAVYPDYKEDVKQSTSTKSAEKKKKTTHAIPIEGLVPGMAIRYAGCCIPIPGDAIFGVINTGTGVTIHNQNCHNLKNLALTPQRILDVCWKGDDEIGDEMYASRVRIMLHNESGSLAEVSSTIAKKKINISNIKITNRASDHFELMVDIEVRNLDHLEEILSTLRISKKIIEVERVIG
jgi:GTP diphosphokinase / guanosine-3',5'-bis(diphosphate) 3'-diphosphatase